MKIEVTHPNGYRGVLYGASSMLIYDKDGKEVLHSGHRAVNTEKGLYNILSEMPEFLKMLKGCE